MIIKVQHMREDKNEVNAYCKQHSYICTLTIDEDHTKSEILIKV